MGTHDKFGFLPTQPCTIPAYSVTSLMSLRTQLGSRGHDVLWDTIQELSEKRRALIRQIEDMRHQLKQGSDRIAELKRNKDSLRMNPWLHFVTYANRFKPWKARITIS